MANHITATENKLLILEYTNGIRTVIIGHGYNSKFVMNSIMERIQKRQEEIIHDIEKDLKEDGYVSCGYVWHIDSDLNFDYNLSQCLIGPNDLLERADIYKLPFPYDLGENEEIEDILKYYPDYKYPHKLKD